MADGCVRAEHPDWTGADAYVGRWASALLDELASDDRPPFDALYVVVVGDQALVIRQWGAFVCPEAPIDRAAYLAARRKVRGAEL